MNKLERRRIESYNTFSELPQSLQEALAPSLKQYFEMPSTKAIDIARFNSRKFYRLRSGDTKLTVADALRIYDAIETMSIIKDCPIAIYSYDESVIDELLQTLDRLGVNYEVR